MELLWDAEVGALYLNSFDSIESLEAGLVEYIQYYNQERIKLKLKGLSPVQYREQAQQPIGRLTPVQVSGSLHHGAWSLHPCRSHPATGPTAFDSWSLLLVPAAVGGCRPLVGTGSDPISDSFPADDE